MIRVLIIEDEIKTAKELKRMVLNLRPDIVVMDILPSVKGSSIWLRENKHPDLIFSDIQLADGLSFDIFENITVNCPVIFCTAFDEYAIKAFEANGIDYLLKPVDEKKLIQSFNKYEMLKKAFENEPNHYEGQMTNLISQLKTNFKSTFLIHSQGKIIPLKVSLISFIHYENGTVSIYTENKRYFYSSTMDELESQLDPSIFFRANRQFIINSSAVDLAENYFSRKIIVKLVMPTPEPIIVSKLKANDFLKWLGSNK